MKNAFLFLLWIVGISTVTIADKEALILYNDVPGLTPSDQYELRVRGMEGDVTWKKVFAFVTQCKEGKKERISISPNLVVGIILTLTSR